MFHPDEREVHAAVMGELVREDRAHFFRFETRQGIGEKDAAFEESRRHGRTWRRREQH